MAKSPTVTVEVDFILLGGWEVLEVDAFPIDASTLVVGVRVGALGASLAAATPGGLQEWHGIAIFHRDTKDKEHPTDLSAIG